jgi:putative phosphoesterase
MTILVFSDSHGRSAKIEEAIRRQTEKPAAVIFLGDGLRDMSYVDTGDIPVYSVRGNCDTGVLLFDNGGPSERSFELGDKKFFITHGHNYGVKITLRSLISEAAAKDTDIVLYGHTHEKLACEMTTDNDYGIKLKKPLYVMNPGSIGSYPYPFGVITVDREGRVLLSHGSLD